jgi:DNA-binding response OmpR family regulator
MQGKTRVLIIDGEVLVQNLLGLLLEGDGFEVFSALSGARGLELARQAVPEAIILDVRLPDMDGFEVCQRLRKTTDAVILFATAKDNKEDVVRGLQLGGDDYVVKPYCYEELVARLKACLRRQKADRRPTFVRSAQGEGLLLDPSQRVVFIENGESVQLTPKEFELLRFMVEKRGQVLSADDILSNVWGPAYVGEKDLVKQFIRRLRSKLELDPSDPQSIVTIRGSGYAFEEVTKPGSLRNAEARGAPGPSFPGSGLINADPTEPALRRRDIVRARFHPPSRAAASFDGRAEGRGAGRRTWHVWAGYYAAGIVLAVLLSAGMVLVASAGALPGGLLYHVKTLSEDVRLAFTPDELQSVQLRLELADRRLDEASRLLRIRGGDEIGPLLAAYEGQVRRARSIVSDTDSGEDTSGRAARILFEDTMREHERHLDDLSGVASAEAQSAILHAIQVVRDETASLRGQAGEPTTVEATPLGLREGDDTRLGGEATEEPGASVNGGGLVPTPSAQTSEATAAEERPPHPTVSSTAETRPPPQGALPTQVPPPTGVSISETPDRNPAGALPNSSARP